MNTRPIVITGAGNGIGLALVRCYIKMGHTVLGVDINPGALTAEPEHGASLHYFHLDMSDMAAITQVIDKMIATHGVPQMWINNAGIVELGAFSDVDPARFEKVFAVNFHGPVQAIRKILPLMEQAGGGKIVNVASLNGVIPAPFMTSYVSSKHALVGFTKSLQLELAQKQSGVSPVLVLPGFVRTAIMAPKNGFEFPSFLGWLIAEPPAIALEIAHKIQRNKALIVPSILARLLQLTHHYIPMLTKSSARVLVAKNIRQALGFEKIPHNR